MMQAKKNLFVITHGCQMNQYDSIRMQEILASDYREIDHPENADLVIINTCSVREKPEKKVLSELGRLRPYKKRRPQMRIVVAGCVAQQLKSGLIDKTPFVDLVIGPDAYPNLPAMLAELDKLPSHVFTEFDRGGFHLEAVTPLERFGQGGKVSAFIAVQKGCNHFCTYCIVPFLRGREKSRPEKEILDEARRYIAAGVKEITLLGQNVNGYGADLQNGEDFVSLLESVAALPGLKRLRFVTSHPAAMNDRQIDAIAEIDVICEYLHLPIQAGSERILKAMKRGYSAADYLSITERLRHRIPELALSGDMIVGFPGETREDFERSLDIVKQLEYSTLFSFVYSSRPGTKAAAMPDPIDRETKLQWLRELQALQKTYTLKANEKLLDSEQEVLVESISKKDEQALSGRTRCNKIVNFPATENLLGSLVRVKITDAYQNSLFGKLIDYRK